MKLEHVSADFEKIVTRKVTAYDPAEHKAKGHKKVMPEGPARRLGALRRRAPWFSLGQRLARAHQQFFTEIRL